MKRIVISLAMAGLMIMGSGYMAQAESLADFIKNRASIEKPKVRAKGRPRVKSLTRKDLEIISSTDGEKLTLDEHLLFEYGLPELRDDVEDQDENIRMIADEMKNYIEKHPDGKFYIEGHTCSMGSDDLNCCLSWARAREISKKLEDEGIDSKYLAERGYGEDYPAHDNDTKRGREKNRRAVIYNDYAKEDFADRHRCNARNCERYRGSSSEDTELARRNQDDDDMDGDDMDMDDEELDEIHSAFVYASKSAGKEAPRRSNRKMFRSEPVSSRPEKKNLKETKEKKMFKSSPVRVKGLNNQ